jgi:anti-sigma regulatory factor (Ser/Thr protein kinase)
VTVRKPRTAKRTVKRTAKAPAGTETTTRFSLRMREEEWKPTGELLLRRSYPSRLDMKQQAMDTVSDLLVARGLVVDADRPWLVLCLDEAVTNAMLHGNEGDPRLEIEVAVAVDARRWHVAISDHGEGFSMESVPDPDDPESLLLEHGRGIRLMRAWLSSLTYWRHGATVVMSRRRADL